MALTKISTGMLKQDAASSDLNIDAGTLYLDVSNNRVGIANTSPSQALDVTGNVVISGTATATTFVGSGASLTSIPNSALTNSSITINSTATSLGGSITLGTDDVAEGSTNLYYTNARADARVALIVDSAPSTLNTLNELAAALGDDANFSTTVTNSIAAKLPLAGGTLTGNLSLGDNVKAQFGASSDLQIYHDGSASRIVDAGTGGLTLQADANVVVQNSAGTEVKAEFTTDGGVNLYYDNAQKLATTSTGIDVTGVITTDGMTTSADINFGDNDRAIFGAGSDLQIFHNGSNSYIQENGTGNLILQADEFLIQNTAGNANYIRCQSSDESVQLRFGGATKLSTKSTGIDVTGEVRSDSLKVDGGTNTEGLTAEVSGVVTDLTIGGITTGADLRFSYDRGNGSTTISEGTRGSETNLQRWAGNGDISFYNSAGTSQDLFWDASTSRLGIGTTLPLTTLEIEDATSQLTIDSTGSSFSRVIHQHNGTSLWTTGTRSASDYHIFRESGAGNVIIDQANVGIGTTSPTQKLEVAGTALVENAKLKAIAESNTDTAVDVFVYDTRKDSDGGAWRKRTQNTSWYNETLNTSTRGSRREFPCVAVIVAETTQLTIYDGDDPNIPMWMVFNRAGSVGSNGNIIQDQYNHQPMPVVALDASIVVGGSFTVKINFASDISYLWADGSGDWIYKAGIFKRNAGLGFTNLDNGNRIINAIINDVAMTVLPNAPIDADTGLPVPTIAVATNGGVSVIKDDGSVVDVTAGAGSAYNGVSFIDIDDNHNLIFEQDTQGRALMYIPIPSADRTSETDSGARTDKRMLNTSSTATGANAIPRFNGSNATIAIAGTGDDQYVYGGTGVTSYAFGGTKLQSSVAHITSDYNTGHMVGDIKLATLSDTDTTNVTGTELVTNGTFDSDTSGWTVTGFSQSSGVLTSSTTGSIADQTITTVNGETYVVTFDITANHTDSQNGLYIRNSDSSSYVDFRVNNQTGSFSGTFTATGSSMIIRLYNGSITGTISYDNISVRLAEPDRSYNGNGLQVSGTVQKAVVETGAELVGYYGWGTNNYLEQPYTTDLDFGAGDFCMMWWQKKDALTGSTAAVPIEFSNPDVDIDGTPSALVFEILNRVRFYTRGTSGGWHFIEEPTDLIAGAWQCYAVVRRGGKKEIWRNGKLAIRDTAIDTRFVTSTSTILRVGKRSDGAGSPFDGMISLVRVTATVPSEEQIKKMYNDEKHLFAPNAKATLYGSSDVVTALAYDDDTELLHVGTSAGRSVFQGLNRVDNTTDAVGAAISASNGFIVEE